MPDEDMSTPLRCPACRETMDRQSFVSASVDVCPACHGLWFDAGELAKFDHKTKGIGAALEQAAARIPNPTPRERPRIDCPHCQEPLDTTPYELEPSVDIDRCARCAGTFLDAGKLRMIRLRERTPAEAARLHRRRRIRRARAERKEEELRRIHRGRSL